MTEAGHEEPEHLEVVHEPVHLPGLEHGEHGLTDVEGVPPVVVFDWPVILFDAQSPSADNLEKTENVYQLSRRDSDPSHLVWDREFVNEIKIDKHPNDNFESFTLLVQSIIELVAENKLVLLITSYMFQSIIFLKPVKVELLGPGYALPRQPVGVVVRGGGVVTQAVQGNSL